MVPSTGVRDAITTLQDLHQRLGLVPAQSDDFFVEWTEFLPTLTASLFPRRHELGQVAQILRVLGQCVMPDPSD
jgi:hypothetical protein